MRRVVLLLAAVFLFAACEGEEPAAIDATPTPDDPAPAPDAPEVTDATPAPTPDEPAPARTTPPEPPAPPDDRWTALPDAPTPLTEVAAAAFGDEVWVAGGLTAGGQATTAVQVYDPTGDRWRQGPPLPQAVHHAALVSTGEELLLVGGYRGSRFGDPAEEVWRLEDPEGDWEEAPALPEPRAAGAAAWDGRRVVYGGGVGPGGVAGDVLVLEDGAWSPLGGLSEPREHLAAAGDGDGRAWFLAGRRGGLDATLTTVDLVEGGAVRRVGDVPTARGGLAGFHAPGLGACAVGGEMSAGTFAEVECIDAEGNVTELPRLEQPRHGLGAAVVDGAAYVVLGGPEPRLTVSATVERLRIEQE